MVSRPAVALASLAATALVGVGVLSASAADTSRMRLDLDNGESLRPGTLVADDAPGGVDGVVVVRYGGTLRSVPGVSGTRAVRFPGPCTNEPCPNAMIKVADRASLDPGTQAFEWGATVNLAPRETAKGENVLQKGLYNQVGGQWKLQIDGRAGHPSCIVSGTRADGSKARILVESSVSVANGTWRRVACRRTARDVSVLVDGVVRGRKASPLLKVSSTAPVTIGAKSVDPQDNDQFSGALDNVFMRTL